MPGIEDLAIGMGMGLVNNHFANIGQLNQQGALNNQAMQNAQAMTIFNREQQEQLWRNTNYGAQIKELKAAGMSPGYLYGKGGAGGAATNLAAESMKPGMAPNNSMGILNANMIAAQIANINADTKKKEVEVGNVTAQTENITAQTINQKLENAYKEGVGLENRQQQEAANIYATNMTGALNELKVEQMPIELQNETQKVVLEGQKIAIMAKEATTHRMQLAVYQKVAELDRNMRAAISTADREERRSSGQANRNTTEHVQKEGREVAREGMAQQNEQFYVNTVMRGIEDAINVVVPWYEPGQETTTGETYYDREGNYAGEKHSKTTRKAK